MTPRFLLPMIGMSRTVLYISLITVPMILLSCISTATPALAPSPTASITPLVTAPHSSTNSTLTAMPASIPPLVSSPKSIYQITPVPTSRPAESPSPLLRTPVPLACDINDSYAGIANPGSAMYLVTPLEDCVVSIDLGPSGYLRTFGSWLPDRSGFVFREGHAQGNGLNSVDDVCIWDLMQRITVRCLIKNGNNYWKALWSPGKANLVAYYRWNDKLNREFVTIAKAESGEIVYETKRALLESGTAERLLAWHPKGKEILISVSNKAQQTAVILDVETGLRRVLATFDGEDKDYLIKGLWIEGGASVLLSVVDSIYYGNPEAQPEARDLYQVHADGTELRRLLKDAKVAQYIEDPTRNRLLLDTYSLGSDPSPLYWLDLTRGTLNRVLDDEAESTYTRLLGLSPDGLYVVYSDRNFRTWLFDTTSGKLTQLNEIILGPIAWRFSS